MPLTITDSFTHNGNTYKFVVFYLSGDPLSYRFVIEDTTSDAQPSEVHNVIRVLNSEVEHPDRVVDDTIRHEFGHIQEEFIESLQNPSS